MKGGYPKALLDRRRLGIYWTQLLPLQLMLADAIGQLPEEGVPRVPEEGFINLVNLSDVTAHIPRWNPTQALGLNTIKNIHSYDINSHYSLSATKRAALAKAMKIYRGYFFVVRYLFMALRRKLADKCNYKFKSYFYHINYMLIPNSFHVNCIRV